MRRLLLPLLAVALLGAPAVSYADITDCPQAVQDVRGTQPSFASISTALDNAADEHDVPAAVLRAIAYQESGWRQFETDGTVVASDDTVCGLGIMQVTADETYTEAEKVELAEDYVANVREGARILAQKWDDSVALGTPPPGGGPDDPDVIENWYYAICLYNGCGTDETYPEKVADIVADPFRYAHAFPWLKAYWFTSPRDVDPGYDLPEAFQARYSPEQEFEFYDSLPSTVVAAPTHSLANTPAPSSEYGAATYGPNDTRTRCTDCEWWRLDATAGLVGRAHWTNSVTGADQAAMTWDPVLTGAGRYRVSAYVPAIGTDTLGTATYTIGTATVTIDQNAAKDMWRSLGDHTLSAIADVKLGDSSAVAGQKLVGDALRVQAVTKVVVTAGASTIAYGSSTTLSIALTHADDEYGGAGQPHRVTLWKRPLGTTAWTKLGTYDPKGLVVTARPTVNTEYKVSFVSPYTYLTDAVTVRRVYVRPKVTASLSGRTLSARVTPAHAGQRVYLQRLTSAGWRNVTYRTLSSTGTASFAITPPGAGTWYYRAYKPADADHVAGASARVTLRT